MNNDVITIIIILIISFLLYLCNKKFFSRRETWGNLFICILLGSILFYCLAPIAIQDLKNQPPYRSLLELIGFHFIAFILALAIIGIGIIAIDLKKNFNNLIRTTFALLFLIGLHITIEDSLKNNNNEFWDQLLKFISKLLEIIAIGSLAGFILSYREEPGFLNRIRTHLTNFKTRFNKSESKNEQAENTTENNQTDTTKSEPEQSSEEKESPHG
ncbi:hypothetical protein [Neisseria dumasiana]|uniref:Colicin V production protein n=1 Tax=Neisseria dumasiana TaxID=1931275 RepID=A0ABX3WKR0_9NEIS|nr:hypothetical protein [Neisseria dumasiana]OSI29982.1 hypothetical protein BV913_11155 [Neisseria dumasiana]UOO85516.1 hypothetical protein LVJ88_06015 [Neisseria dumasiana]